MDQEDLWMESPVWETAALSTELRGLEGSVAPGIVSIELRIRSPASGTPSFVRPTGQGCQPWGSPQGASEGVRARKKVRTACTRRFSSVESPGRSSLRKMLRTCASTVFGET